MSKISKIKIQNFKGLEHYEGEVMGRDVYLIGKNEAGKSSFIDAVFLALNGKNPPPKPVTKGAKKGLIEVHLDDGYIVRNKLSATGKTPITLEIENINATSDKDQFVKSPRTWLNNRIGTIDFDVNDFFRKSDAEQVKYFAKVTGLDVSGIDAEIEDLSESRKYDKLRLTELQNQSGIWQAGDELKELIDVIQLSKDIADLKEKERQKAETYTHVTDGIADREKQAKEYERQVTEINAKMNGGEYFDQYGKLFVVEQGINQEIKSGYDWLEIAENKPVPNKKLEEMEAEFENSEEINNKISDAKKFALVDKQVEKTKEAIEGYNTDIQEQRDLKAKLIAEQIKIEGLTYDIENECFLFNGLPFDKTQINTASQIMAGLKIGASLLNEVKILKFDASLIDVNNFEKIQSWSKSEGIELFVELVDREAGELKIEIEEY